MGRCLSCRRRQTHRDRARDIRPPILCAGVIQNLVERDAREIGELHLDNWPHPFHGRADRRPDHRVFADRRVEHAAREFCRETFGGLEGAPEFSAHVLSVDKDTVVLAQEVRLRFANGVEVSHAHDGNDEFQMANAQGMTNGQ